MVDRDVTGTTTAAFTGLQPDTEYTFRVWPLGEVYSTEYPSQVAEMTGRTERLTPLATPTVTSFGAGAVEIIQWDEIDHASAYRYDLSLNGESVSSGETTRNSLEIADLELGTYAFSVTALTSTPGFEQSAAALASVTVSRTELWTVEGTYTSAVLGEEWPVTMVAYSDGGYKLRGWYGVEGYDINFLIDPAAEDPMIMYGYDYDESTYGYLVPTGREDKPQLAVYTWYGYSNLAGDQDAGNATFYIVPDNKADLFEWGEPEQPGLTVDDIVGTYSAPEAGYEYSYDIDDWIDYDAPTTLTIEKVTPTSITIAGFCSGSYLWDGGALRATVDLEARTITIPQGQMLDAYYRLGGVDEEAVDVTAIINDDGTITFPDGYGLWYSGYSYVLINPYTMTKE